MDLPYRDLDGTWKHRCVYFSEGEFFDRLCGHTTEEACYQHETLIAQSVTNARLNELILSIATIRSCVIKLVNRAEEDDDE